MKFYLFLYMIAGLLTNISAQVAAVHFTVYIPGDGGKDQKVYLAGSFNYWHAGDSLYRMQRAGNGVYTITIPVFENQKYEYKYTAGSWDRVELAVNDSNISNRSFLSKNEKRIIDTVSKWKQAVKAEKKTNPQLDAINAKKDSVLTKLQPELENMQKILKLYVENMLQEKPSLARKKRLIKTAEKKIKYAFEEITSLLWDIFTSLKPEQKKEILKLIKQPGNDSEFLNTLGNAFNKVMEENSRADSN